MNTPTVYGIPNCDSVKKARAWLAQQGAAHTFVDFKKTGAPEPLLALWLTQLDWQSLLNRKGTTWRQLAPSEQAAVVDAASASRLMQQHTSAIKRPVIVWPSGRVTAGYAPDQWPALLGGASQPSGPSA